MTGTTGSPPCPPGSLPTTGLREVVGAYRAVILDVWGVLIDGRDALPEAAECLRQLRRHDVPVLLLSNSSRSADSLLGYLDELGVPVDQVDHVVTSGELAAEQLDAGGHRRVFAIGAPEGTEWLGYGGRTLVDDPDHADVVVATGAVRDENLLPGWREQLGVAARRGVPMICANPDREVYVGSRRVLAAGHLADCYLDLGGTVTWCGKPTGEAYRSCLARLGVAAGDVLAVGDSLTTDIAGAAGAGLHSVLVVADGVHQNLADLPSEALWKALRTHGTALPTYTLDRLRW